MSAADCALPTDAREDHDGLHGPSTGPRKAPAEAPRFTREELGYSRPLRWDRIAMTESGKAAVAAILNQLQSREARSRARRAADLIRLDATIEAMLIGLYACAKANPTMFLVYSRNANDFDHGRYSNALVTLTVVRTVADFLNLAGLTEGAPGYFDRSPNPFGGPGGRGRRTRVRATLRLVALLEDAGMSVDGIGQLATSESIRLKASAPAIGQTKPLIDYLDTKQTNGLRESLADLNALIAATRIDLDMVDHQDLEAVPDDADAEDRSDANDRSARQLYRVFNNSSFEEGGRFYGGWWQALSKADRQRLLIEGEPTVELDFKSMHARLCYQFEGIPLAPEVDPYCIPGLPHAPRWLVKAAVNRLLNAAPGKTPKAPEGASEGLPPGMTWRRLLAHVEAHHRPIASWFRSGRGMRLQYLDSAIAETVLRYLTLRRVPCLPVHDSFIVPESREHLLGETMFLAYYSVSGKHGAAKVHPVITGWSSTAMEHAVRDRLEGG